MNFVKVDPNKSTLLSAGSALSFIVLLGIVSLFSDLTYEGARSLNGQFLSFLAACRRDKDGLNWRGVG